MDFVKNNALLIGLAVGSGILLLLPSIKKNASGVPNLSSADAVTLINRSNALVLDVRDAAEFDAGHIAEALNIPVDDLNARIGELKKYKNKAILVNCQRGLRGSKACDVLRKAEFTQVHHLQGGLDAWLKANLPVVSKVANAKELSAPKKTAVKRVAKAPETMPSAANDDAKSDGNA